MSEDVIVDKVIYTTEMGQSDEVNRSPMNVGRNEVKPTSDSLRKILLDDLTGDSSLEPGEVKTPPPNSIPFVAKFTAKNTEPTATQRAKAALAKALKAVSQMEAEVCEEKVRTILELDAKRRKEESEKRKQDDRNRQSQQIPSEIDIKKRKTKEERKKARQIRKGNFFQHSRLESILIIIFR